METGPTKEICEGKKFHYCVIYFSLLYSSLANLISQLKAKALFSFLPNSKFFHSLSVTSIFGRMHGALNIGKINK
jgi:hypothetical protein